MYASKKKIGMASVNGSGWLNVFVIYAGTILASNAASSDTAVLFVSCFDIRYAGMTNRDANILGMIFSTN